MNEIIKKRGRKPIGDYALIIERVKSGETMDSIAQSLNCHAGSVRSVCYRMGIKPSRYITRSNMGLKNPYESTPLKILAFIFKNPLALNVEIAESFRVSREFVRQLRLFMKNEGMIK